MRTLQIETARVFRPLLEPARYKGAHGGRGSGKSHFFAEYSVEDALRWPGDTGEGLRLLSFREIQKSLKESAKFLIESKIRKFGLGEADGFKIFTDRIQTPGDGVIAFTGMQDHTADSIKSYEGFHKAWGEEAHTISSKSLSLLRPTIRWESKRLGMASELGFSWNATRKSDAVDAMLRGGAPPTGSVCVRANWSDNPWFPKVLDQERLDCLNNQPEQYDHIWEGGYATVLSGAYFARHLEQAKQQGRIGEVPVDPLMRFRVYCDLGGTGAKADAFSMWVVQFVGLQVRVLDYYEAVGQPLDTHIHWLHKRGYTPDRADVWLPHDGDTNDRIHDVSFASAFRAAGYDVEVVPNQGRGAASIRIEAARRLFPAVWFNEKTTEPGRDALGWYHEKKDEDRQIGLGPEHDWSSHAADAFGLMCVCYEEPYSTEDEDDWQRENARHTRSSTTGY